MSSVGIDQYIIEIEDQRDMWDRCYSEYTCRNKTSKAKAWEEICDIFVPGYRYLSSIGKNKSAHRYNRNNATKREMGRQHVLRFKKKKHSGKVPCKKLLLKLENSRGLKGTTKEGRKERLVGRQRN